MSLHTIIWCMWVLTIALWTFGFWARRANKKALISILTSLAVAEADARHAFSHCPVCGRGVEQHAVKSEECGLDVEDIDAFRRHMLDLAADIRQTLEDEGLGHLAS